jgi:UDPglucose 6-dehydrogenase
MYKISVIGTGYVGLVTGICFSEIGHSVICQDIERRKIDILKKGKSPIYEPHLEKLIAKNLQKGKLEFTEDPLKAINNSEIIFICVGTPPLKNGEADLSAVENVTRLIAQHANTPKLIVEKSTVPVQTGMNIQRTVNLFNNKGLKIDVASNPEFLREGSAVEDFLHPDRIVIGTENEKSEKLLKNIYKPIINKSFNCPIHKNCSKAKNPAFLTTDIKSAELIKHASNSFLATKISFINAIADICEKTGADVTKVAFGMGLDPRIGSHFLNAGIGFGGFCFPKDLQAFIRIAEKLDYDFSLLKEVEKINENRISALIKKIKNNVWIIKGKTFGILGLSFKPNTDDIRFAPSIKIIKALKNEGAIIKAYDPQALDNAKKLIPDITYCNSPYEVPKQADALIITTEWEEFKRLNFQKIKSFMKRPLIFDCRNFLDSKKVELLGFEYIGIGR